MKNRLNKEWRIERHIPVGAMALPCPKIGIRSLGLMKKTGKKLKTGARQSHCPYGTTCKVSQSIL